MKSLKAQFLVAAPTLLDPNFMQTVALIVQHDENGALGLVVNRATQMSVKEAWEQVSETSCHREGVIYMGGPCEGVLMALHTVSDLGQIEVMPGLYFTTDTKYMEKLMNCEDEAQIRFFVGYSGWTAGQLEGEMESGSWQVAPGSIERVFGADAELWRRMKREISLAAILGKVNPRLIPRDPSHN